MTLTRFCAGTPSVWQSVTVSRSTACFITGATVLVWLYIMLVRAFFCLLSDSLAVYATSISGDEGVRRSVKIYSSRASLFDLQPPACGVATAILDLDRWFIRPGGCRLRIIGLLPTMQCCVGLEWGGQWGINFDDQFGVVLLDMRLSCAVGPAYCEQKMN